MSEPNAPFLTPSALSCGTPVLVRPIRNGDALWLTKGLLRLSPQNRVRRFFYDKEVYSPKELQRLTTFDETDHIALVAAILDQRGAEIDVVAVARCFRHAADPDLAEVAITTVDEWQRRGVGALLIRALAQRAWDAGIRRWQAVFFSANKAPLKLLETVAQPESVRAVDAGVSEAIYRLHPAPIHEA